MWLFMAIKPQDIVVLTKLIVCFEGKDWSQNSIASELCLSPSQINSAFKRLVYAGLLTPYRPPNKPQPIIQVCEEFFIHGIKYVFPGKLGEMARGIRTSYAALASRQCAIPCMRGNADIFYDYKDTITVVQLPVYSPDLNPIEKLWKR